MKKISNFFYLITAFKLNNLNNNNKSFKLLFQNSYKIKKFIIDFLV